MEFIDETYIYIFSLLLAITFHCVEDNETELNPKTISVCESIGIF